jgi:hypothetical protein
MTQEDPWFFEERAVAFASLVLTKRRDVLVGPHAGTDPAVDLLVAIRTAGHSTRRRLFGVRMVEYMDLPNIRDVDERVAAHFSGNHCEVRFPVCVFAIGVRKPEGIYRWVVEPVVEDGRALLRRDVEANWQSRDEPGAARLIDRVNAWYDALHGGPTPKTRGRRSKEEA